MTSDYHIKPATADDIEQFSFLFEKSLTTQFSEYSNNVISYFMKHEYPTDVLQNAVASGKLFLFLAQKEEENVGFLIGKMLNGGIGFCEWIAVDNSHQRQGVGSALLKTWEEKVISSGGHKVHLWTAEHNSDYYKKVGYTLVGKVPDNFFGSDDIFMYKSLRESDEKEFLKEYLSK